MKTNSLHICTDRFYIRPVAKQDAEGLFLMDSNKNVHKYLVDKVLNSIAEAQHTIEFIKRQYEEFGFGRWAIIDKTTNEFVGWTGFKYITEQTNKHRNYHDFGYRLREEYWGKGVATETGIACIKYAIEELKLTEIYAICDINNLASANVIHKCGFTKIDTFDFDGKEHFWFSLLRN